MKSGSTRKGILEELDDEGLIANYHAHPLILLISNMIVTVLGILALCSVSWFEEGSYIPFVLMFVAALAVLLCGFVVPGDKRAVIAKIMRKRHQKKGDTESDPYFYLYRREQELYGKLRDEKTEKILIGISVVFRLINVVFYLFVGLMLLAVTLVAGLMIGLFLSALNLVLVAFRGHSSGRNIFAPLSWTMKPAGKAFAFLKLVFRWNPKADGDPAASRGRAAGADPLTARSSSLSDYVSLNFVGTPASSRWSRGPSLSVSGTTIRVEGTICGDAAVYRHEYEMDALAEHAKEEIMRTLRAQAEEFARHNPSAGNIDVDVNIEVEIR